MVMAGTVLGAKVAMDVAAGVEMVLFGRADVGAWRSEVGFVLAIRVP